MSGSCCAGFPEGEPLKAEMRAEAKAFETAIEQECRSGKQEKTEKSDCGCEVSRSSSRHMTQLPIVWQRLVAVDGRTCPRCDATSQHLQNAVAKLREVLSPLNVEPRLEFREIGETSFKDNPTESNRIWIAGKPLEEWLGASIGSSPCCSVCGDASCRTMVVEGATFEDIPEAVILKAALVAASGLIRQTS